MSNKCPSGTMTLLQIVLGNQNTTDRAQICSSERAFESSQYMLKSIRAQSKLFHGSICTQKECFLVLTTVRGTNIFKGVHE